MRINPYGKFLRNQFSDVQFNSEADFGSVQFNSKAYFQDAQFHSVADFTSTVFKSTGFNLTTLPDTLLFDRVRLSETIDLTSTRLNSTKKANGAKCYISLIDAPIEKFKLRYDNFRVYVPASTLSATQYEKLTNVYEDLLKNFQNRGYLRSYETLDKEYQQFQYLRNPDFQHIWMSRNFNRIKNWLFKNWWGYGYNKPLVLLNTLLILVFFTLHNWIRFHHMITRVYTIKNIKEHYVKSSTWKNLPLAFFYTVLIFFGLKISTEEIKFNNYSGVIILFIQYVFGLLCLAFIVDYFVSSPLK